MAPREAQGRHSRGRPALPLLFLVFLLRGAPTAGALRGLEQPAFNTGRSLKAAPGPNELLPVPRSNGWIIPPATSADGQGAIAFNDRIPTGLVVGNSTEVPTVEDCARACRAKPPCNVFAYCAQQAGCSIQSNFGNVTALRAGGCVLLEQGLSAPETGRPVITLSAPGFTGGAPITATAEPLDGYELALGQGFFNRYDSPCNDSIGAGQCMLRGTPQELKARCDASPVCRIMVWLPSGWDYIAPPLVNLKGALGLTVNSSDSTLNQNATSYIKLAPPAPLPSPSPSPSPDANQASSGESSGLSAGAIAGIAVGAAAVLAAAAAGFLLVRHRRRQLDSLARAASAETAGSKQSVDGRNPSLDDSSGVAAAPLCTPADLLSQDPPAGEALTTVGSPPPWKASARVPPPRTASAHSAGSGGTGAGDGAATRSSSQQASAASGGARHQGGQATRAGSSGTTTHLLSQPSGEGSLEAGAGSTLSGGSGTQAPGSPTSSSLDARTASSDQRLLARMPTVPWQDEVVAYDSIDFCRRPDGSYQELGSGAFGSVYKVLLDGVQPYAAKVLDLGQSEEVQNTFLREASLLRRMRHRNVVGFRGVCIHEGRGILLMELMEGGDLFPKITAVNKATGERVFGWYGRGRRVALDIARGIHYLHSLHVTHFDIKCGNVLLTRDLTAKISDVGFARLMSNTHHSVRDGKTGTFAYMAPELLMGRHCTESVDIYSFGLVLWEICTGEHPMRGRNRPLRVPGDCPADVATLCEECMSEEPSGRPTARELLERLTNLVVPPGAVDRR